MQEAPSKPSLTSENVTLALTETTTITYAELGKATIGPPSTAEQSDRLSLFHPPAARMPRGDVRARALQPPPVRVGQPLPCQGGSPGRRREPGRAVTSKGAAALAAGSPSLARRALRLAEGHCAKRSPTPGHSLPGRERGEQDRSLLEASGQAAAPKARSQFVCHSRRLQRNCYRAQQQLEIVLDTR